MARILIIAADGTAIDHLDHAYFRLLEEGFDVTIASARRGLLKTALHWGGPDVHSFYIERPGYIFPAHATFEEIDPSKYDGLVIPGGRAPEYLRNNQGCLDLVRYFIQNDKPITSLCHGPLLLLAAGLRGRRLTCSDDVAIDVPTFKNTFIEAKGEKEGEPDYHIDGNIVTARGWWHYYSWIQQFLHMLEQRGIVPPKNRKTPKSRVLMIAGEHTSAGQLSYGFERLCEEGLDVTIAAPEKAFLKTIVDPREEGWDPARDTPGPYQFESLGYLIPSHVAIGDVDASKFDALLLPGGRAPEYLRAIKGITPAVQHFVEANKPIGAICTAARLLVAAGIKGRKMTGADVIKTEIAQDNTYVPAGAAPVVDGSLVTVSGRPHYHVWIKAFLSLLSSNRD